MFRNWRWWGLGLIALVVIVGLTVFLAPAGNIRQRGSTYSRAPDGYSAWYEFMQQQGHRIKRWQKPSDRLKKMETPITLVRVNSQLSPGWLSSSDADWIRAGHVLIELGIQRPVTAAAFTTLHRTPYGAVKIQTRRRFAQYPPEPYSFLLRDEHGGIIQQVSLDKGQYIQVITPYLAANAYQSEAGNFAYLESLVIQPGFPIYVDEFIHGYKDAETRQQKGRRDWISYLARTPWRVIFMQALMIGLAGLWGLNARLGPAQSLRVTEPDNSRMYINALAAVLMKAGASGWVVETIQKAEQQHLQRQLGLGDELLDITDLAAIWEQRTGRSAEQLTRIFTAQPRRWRDQALVAWLTQLQELRTVLERPEHRV
ncbi:MAG: DUF4350 domain-containing protein [Gloeomargarita sp. SKYG116]|nr:DUF4350 domain-containing protein [Gloeomargarita sp. SKYG116]MCS7225727.1 DUF4350 domain-containing protein [Gloeomargarita sp. SKYB31]MDW8401574.1 DUF4350 domain-containing protein [Gloeomargarita sp. SKYGB_i_bin116]